MGGPNKPTGSKNPKFVAGKSRKETSTGEFRSTENYASDSDCSNVSVVSNPHTAQKVPMRNINDLSQ